ncbi:SIR2 family protein [Hansschlegelia beijingensis]|uniref:STAND NTPase 4 small alpha/beta domain-containing protein n=1 Tax=Hansschlegelia beijingensis TaxID=1133344 RepID=A0A7W6GG62_9HYPH|nr:SIR2 family protein [Hansschlegelia beijingensis]MBB3973758.1 hypothetical protein [Hansschlegelia beijingensis]
MPLADESLLREDAFPGNIQAFTALSNEMRSSKIVPFVGAGASAPAYPTWPSLLSKLLEKAQLDGFITDIGEVALCRSQIISDPLELASTLERRMTKSVFRSFIADIFRNSNAHYTASHSNLCKLPTSAFITTNYDDGLEVAYAASCQKSAFQARATDRSELARWTQGDVFSTERTTVLHWHGTAADPDGMMLTSDDYDQFYSDSHNTNFIRHLLASRQVLFIGFSFNDPFLSRLAEGSMRSAQTGQRHFAFIGRPTDQPTTPLIREQFMRKYRISPIFYALNKDALTGFSSHESLQPLLELLLSNTGIYAPHIAPGATDAPAESSPFTNSGRLPANAPLAAHDLRDLGDDLLMTRSGRPLYVDPRLTKPMNASQYETNQHPIPILLSEVVGGKTSYLISCRPEHGATTLCRRLRLDLTNSGSFCLVKDANSLPAYQAKLMKEFNGSKTPPGAVLILDNFSIERHERLIRELHGLSIFSRFILVSHSFRTGDESMLRDPDFPFELELAELEGLHRQDIRTLTASVFETSDSNIISSVVDRVYSDLLSLCIPLTPTNVIMYITILYKEGDFQPLNRVQIMERYIQQVLTRPSNDYIDSFNSRNKIDLVGSFVFRLFSQQKSLFTKAEWSAFCEEWMNEALIQFDSLAILTELLDSKILCSVESTYGFRYRLFYSYFLGRHVSDRPALLADFLRSDSHMDTDGLVDVISGTSVDSTELIVDLTHKLRSSLDEFKDRYFDERFDPLLDFQWPINTSEERALWDPINRAIEAGPTSASEIDNVKRSLLSERRTHDQTVVIRRFDRMKQALARMQRALIDALVNSSYVSGHAKRTAVECVLESYEAVFQIALFFSPVIATSRIFAWNGIAFLNEMNFEESVGIDERIYEVVCATPNTITSKAIDDIGTRKLSEAFKKIVEDGKDVGFSLLLKYALILRSKANDWPRIAESVITDTNRNSFYMRAMLFVTFDQLQTGVNSLRERQDLKRLIALIQAKRELRKDAPGAKAVNGVLRSMEESDYFREQGNSSAEH